MHLHVSEQEPGCMAALMRGGKNQLASDTLAKKQTSTQPKKVPTASHLRERKEELAKYAHPAEQ